MGPEKRTPIESNALRAAQCPPEMAQRVEDDPVLHHVVASVETPAGLVTLKLASFGEHEHAMVLMLVMQSKAAASQAVHWHMGMAEEVATDDVLEALFDSGGYPLLDQTAATLNALSVRLSGMLTCLNEGSLAPAHVIGQDLAGAGPAVLLHAPVERWSPAQMAELASALRAV